MVLACLSVGLDIDFLRDDADGIGPPRKARSEMRQQAEKIAVDYTIGTVHCQFDPVR
jgi:hypothetical protein